MILVISHFGFEGGTLVLIAPVSGCCLYFTSSSSSVVEAARSLVLYKFHYGNTPVRNSVIITVVKWQFSEEKICYCLLSFAQT